MKRTKILLIIIALIGLNSCQQNLTCEDFKIGEFYIPTNEELKKYTIISKDSTNEIITERDLTISKYIIVRKKNTQIEWKNGIGNGNPKYEIIEWIDDCTYRLTYDSTKSELDERQKWTNDNNGIVVTKTKIKNNCMFYTATMTTKDGREISQNGTICKK